MNVKTTVLITLVLVSAVPLSAGDKKKHQPDRALLEKMEAVPCGAKQKGLAGLGSFWASIGITHVTSDEKLCPQYLLRTDEMDYRIRPTDLRHPAVLPIGHEVVFKIKNDHMLVKDPEGDKETRSYQVVAMEPATTPENTSARSEKP